MYDTRMLHGHSRQLCRRTSAIELGEVAYYTTHFYMLFAVGLILFIITFIINFVSDVIFHKHTRVQG